jgi:hypothetical protein
MMKSSNKHSINKIFPFFKKEDDNMTCLTRIQNVLLANDRQCILHHMAKKVMENMERIHNSRKKERGREQAPLARNSLVTAYSKRMNETACSERSFAVGVSWLYITGGIVSTSPGSRGKRDCTCSSLCIFHQVLRGRLVAKPVSEMSL